MAIPTKCISPISTAFRSTSLHIAPRPITSYAFYSTRPICIGQNTSRTCQRDPVQRRCLNVKNHTLNFKEHSRCFSQSTPRFKLTTIDQIKARNAGGPFNLTAAVLFIAAAGGLWVYFKYEKERLARKRIAEQTKGVGKPKVGGPFSLIDHNGAPFTSDDLLGKYSLVYFGFTHCPDICPDELDKMALMYNKVVAQCGAVLTPLMITCDPARDKPSVLKGYLAEFHPEIVGLTGEYERIKSTCKAYRVYFSTPESVKPGEDYLVDHSIYFYLMDPEGDFVEAIGRNFTADQAAKVITDHIKDWEKPLKKEQRWQ